MHVFFLNFFLGFPDLKYSNYGHSYIIPDFNKHTSRIFFVVVHDFLVNLFLYFPKLTFYIEDNISKRKNL